jgi:hypothetical protein
MFRKKNMVAVIRGTTSGIRGESTNSALGIRDSGLALIGLNKN